MAADGFVSLSRPDAGFNLIFLRTGLATFKPDSMRDRHADGLLVVFVVDDVDAECARLQQEGVAITTPLQTEPWGERFFQVSRPQRRHRPVRAMGDRPHRLTRRGGSSVAACPPGRRRAASRSEARSSSARCAWRRTSAWASRSSTACTAP